MKCMKLYWISDMNIFLCKSFLFIGNIIIKKRNFELLRTSQHFLMSVLKPCEVNRKKESNDNIFRYFPKYLVKRVFLFPFFFCVSKCWYSCYFTSTRAFLHPKISWKFVAVSWFVILLLSLKDLFDVHHCDAWEVFHDRRPI